MGWLKELKRAIESRRKGKLRIESGDKDSFVVGIWKRRRRGSRWRFQEGREKSSRGTRKLGRQETARRLRANGLPTP